MKRTRKVTRLRSLATKQHGARRLVVNVDLNTGKADGPHKKKLRTYLEIVVRDKVDVTYETWKEVPAAQKDLIWEDIHRQFKSDLTKKWALAAEQDDVDDIACEKYDISKDKWAQFCETRRDPSWEVCTLSFYLFSKKDSLVIIHCRCAEKGTGHPEAKHCPPPHALSRGGYEYLEQKLMAEKTKKKLEEAARSGSNDGVIDPPSPIKCHVKWKMARMKKIGQMTSEITKEITEKIDVLTAAIRRPEHPSRVRATGASVTIKKYFGSVPRTSCSSSSLHPEDLQQLTQQIRDQLEESITENVTRQLMASFSQMQSQFQSHMQSQGLALPPEPEVGPSGPRVSTKESCVDPSGNDLETGDSDKCGLYIKANLPRLVALGRLYEGSTVHNIPLLPGQVKVGVEEVKDEQAPVPIPTDEVTLMGQALNTFLAWPTRLVKALSEWVDDPSLYLMTLTILELFLKPFQVNWDATVFGVFNPDFPLYIKHKDLFEIAHGGQCLNISIIQLWILDLTETSMRAGNSDVYGFLEPQSIQRSEQSQFDSESYIKSWMPDNYLKGIINNVIDEKEELSATIMSCQSGPLGPSRSFLQKAVASGGSNLARLGELGGKLLPYFAINRGRSEEEKGSAFLAFLILSKLLRKIIFVKKIQAEALPYRFRE
ncbi:hypothetical protein HKD37_11G031998 [Glycine soja]